ncbi:hypothetical protein [Mycoplasma zalophi]|uniref:hypothetical protein n=1 Tax=Mycoplasma zalophi TaxID=191287 RepID=UPI001C116B87|nr:hypothetical protein [Mycoplasma zalophi]MBU4690920.1 hypothetical protein [Mycoplasma zalophi]
MNPILSFFLENIIPYFISVVFGFLIGNYEDARNFFMRIFYFIKYINYKKIVLVWMDDSQAKSKITKRLSEQNPNIKFISLNKVKDFLKFPLLKIFGIIFFISDVTKLSANEKNNTKYQTKILKYVEKGRFFIGTHDILYRRTNAKEISAKFDYEVNEFEIIDKDVNYILNEEYKNLNLVKKIKENKLDHFALRDNEIVWGEFNEENNNFEVLYWSDRQQLKNNVQVPLLIHQKTNNQGDMYWINSADKRSEGKKNCLEKADSKIIRLISLLINDIADTKNK